MISHLIKCQLLAIPQLSNFGSNLAMTENKTLGQTIGIKEEIRFANEIDNTFSILLKKL